MNKNAFEKFENKKVEIVKFFNLELEVIKSPRID